MAYFYGAPATTGSATTGVQFSRGSLVKPSFRASQRIYWESAEASPSASHPDGYGIGESIFAAFTADTVDLSSFTLIGGSGELVGEAILARLSEATLTGVGDLTAELAVITPGEAALSGSGSLTADILAVSSLSSALSGSGGLTASISATVPVEAALSGSGAVAGSTNLTGIGRLEGSITPFTDLSPESLAASLMSQTVETGYDLESALRLILSSVAGKISGAGTSTITIRSVTDGTDRIVATVDSNGNRTSITYDVGDE